jgi:hypothetical protein
MLQLGWSGKTNVAVVCATFVCEEVDVVDVGCSIIAHVVFNSRGVKGADGPVGVFVYCERLGEIEACQGDEISQYGKHCPYEAKVGLIWIV